MSASKRLSTRIQKVKPPPEIKEVEFVFDPKAQGKRKHKVVGVEPLATPFQTPLGSPSKKSRYLSSESPSKQSASGTPFEFPSNSQWLEGEFIVRETPIVKPGVSSMTSDYCFLLCIHKLS